MSGTLFFTECMPIRNDFAHFGATARSRWGSCILNWSAIDPDGYRLFCSHAVYREIVEKTPHLTNYVFTTTPDEEAALLDLVRPWTNEGIAFWLDLVNGVARPEFAVFEQILDRVHAMYPFENLVMWGSNGFVTRYCRAHDILPVFMELAPFRPPFPSTFYADPRGVNGMHSANELTSANVEEFESRFVPSDILLERLVANPLAAAGPLDNAIYYRPNEIRRGRRDKKLLLAPLQIFDDVNILLHSPFKSMEAFATHILSEFPSDEYDIVFKPHPGCYTRGGLTLADHAKTRRIVDRHSNASWHDDEVGKDDYLPFLTSFDGVVNINSSVGFESSMLGIPVLTLGDAPYRLKDGIKTVSDYRAAVADDLPNLLEQQRKVASFLFLTTFMREQGLRDDPALFQARLALMRVYAESGASAFAEAVAANLPYQTWLPQAHA